MEGLFEHNEVRSPQNTHIHKAIWRHSVYWQLLTAGRLREGVSCTVESGEVRVCLVASSPCTRC